MSDLDPDLEQLRKKLKRMSRKFPPALIERARALRDKGEFNRAIRSTVPDDMDHDRLTLECGHETVIHPGLIMMLKDVHRPTCNQCLDEWLEREAGPSVP